jgi:hypothetical protein
MLPRIEQRLHQLISRWQAVHADEAPFMWHEQPYLEQLSSVAHHGAQRGRPHYAAATLSTPGRRARARTTPAPAARQTPCSFFFFFFSLSLSLSLSLFSHLISSLSPMFHLQSLIHCLIRSSTIDSTCRHSSQHHCRFLDISTQQKPNANPIDLTRVSLSLSLRQASQFVVHARYVIDDTTTNNKQNVQKRSFKINPLQHWLSYWRSKTGCWLSRPGVTSSFESASRAPGPRPAVMAAARRRVDSTLRCTRQRQHARHRYTATLHTGS